MITSPRLTLVFALGMLLLLALLVWRAPHQEQPRPSVPDATGHECAFPFYIRAAGVCSDSDLPPPTPDHRLQTAIKGAPTP